MPSSDRLRDYRRKRTPGKTSEPKTATSRGQSQGQSLRQAPGRGQRASKRRSSSSSVTRRGRSTTTFASNATARSRAGPCQRACRSSRASNTSLSTSKTIRSSTRPSRARSPRASRAPGHGDLGPRNVRAARGEEGRRPDVPARRQAPPGNVGSHPGTPLRPGEELAAPAQAGKGRGAAGFHDAALAQRRTVRKARTPARLLSW